MSRQEEALQIVELRRAASIGRLMLGELHKPLEEISTEEYKDMPRKRLKALLAHLKDTIKPELKKFCAANFEDTNTLRLASLYQDLIDHGSQLRMPYTEFRDRVGTPRQNRLKGAPLHATICISPWGLQTEFPEMHLMRDMAIAFNKAMESQRFIDSLGQIAWSEAKETETRATVAESLSMFKFSGRMCLLSAFNLLEAYINGLSWEFTETRDSTLLSKGNQSLLRGEKGSLIERLVKVPAIIASRETGPFHRDQDPVSGLSDIIKPFRDSVVHASPFSKPDRFGGYEKLDKIYSLDLEVVQRGVQLTLQAITDIHVFLGGTASGPIWLATRDSNGFFIVEHK
jgi:hypothetical protein